MPAHTLVCFLHSKPEYVEKVKEKLQEANQVYSKDKDTLAWHVSLHRFKLPLLMIFQARNARLQRSSVFYNSRTLC